jgi:hypothetical protein
VDIAATKENANAFKKCLNVDLFAIFYIGFLDL